MFRGIVFFLLSTVFSLAYCRSVINSGSGTIVVDNDYVKCDTLICPPGSVGCVIRKRNNNMNNTLIDVSRRCLGPRETITAEENEQIVARNGEQYDMTTSITGNSNTVISSVNSATGNHVDGKQLAAEINRAVQASVVDAKELTAKINREVQARVDESMRLLQKQLRNSGIFI